MNAGSIVIALSPFDRLRMRANEIVRSWATIGEVLGVSVVLILSLSKGEDVTHMCLT